MRKLNKNYALYSICMAVGFIFFGYLEAEERRLDKSDWKTAISRSHGGAYTARYIYAGQDKVQLRLYETRSGRLLAERIFFGISPFVLHWKADRLVISNNKEGSYFDEYIELPPTYLEWLKARLL